MTAFERKRYVSHMLKRIAVTGATGFIGRALVGTLLEKGYDVVALTRETAPTGFPAGVTVRHFDANAAAANPGAFAGADGVIHLAGETVSGRWTPEKKRRIRDSRVRGTDTLVASLAAMPVKPAVLVSASAVGFYGSRGDEPLFENAAPGTDFLASVCAEWEHSALAAEQLGIRTVCLRTGIVLGDGGALRAMIPPFKLGAGGPFGSGRQFVPWIHLDDVVALYLFALENAVLHGPVNAVTPDYASSARFSQALGSALGRPALLPAPGFALQLVLGEFAETLTASQLVLPAAAENAGFVWQHPNLERAMIAAVAPGSNRNGGVRTFESEQFVPQPIETVFSFFSDARNLERITPPALRFEIVAAPDALAAGAEIAYKLHLHGVPFSWKTLIARWEAPNRFVDVQLRGPYACWNHEHSFESVAGGTMVRDHVTYVLPLAPFGALGAGLVESDVNAIFAFRRGAIEAALGAPKTAA